MTPEERQLLDGLFERIRQSSAAPRDREAEDLIQRAVQAQPYAPYLLAQAVIVQEEALKAAAARMQELEAERDAARADAQRPAAGGFLGGLFGGPATSAPRSASGIPSVGGSRPVDGGAMSAQPGGPWGGAGGGFGGRPGPFGAAAPGAGGGSFLRGALATAAGVAGGALLFSGIQSMLSGGVGEEVSKLGEDVQGALGGAPVEPINHDDTAGTVDDASFDDFDADDGGGDGGDWA